jgi:hypothetical protein
MKGIVALPRRRTDNLVIRELDDETLVYDTESDEAHCLNQTAALVWKHCDGKTNAREAVQSLQSALGVPVGTDIVWLAVKQLERFHLVEGSQKSPSVSRRALVLKYAPAALALPVINVNHRAHSGAGGKLRYPGPAVRTTEQSAMLFGAQL